MYDKSKLGQKIWLRLIGHPVCTAPVVAAAGCTAFGMAAQDGGMFFFAGALSFLFGIGAVVVRYAYKYKDVEEAEIAKAKAAFEAERNVVANKREEELDAFRRKLTTDDYSRDEHLLDDLRNIANAFRSDRTWVDNVPETLSANVLSRLDTMFEAAIGNLDRSFKLRMTSRNVRGDGKKELLDASEKLLDDVQKSIETLGELLAGVTKLSIKRLTGATLGDTELADNMRELRTILEVAERTENTRQQLLKGDDDDDRYKEYQSGQTS